MLTHLQIPHTLGLQLILSEAAARTACPARILLLLLLAAHCSCKCSCRRRSTARASRRLCSGVP